jgi:hypothetical protein
MLELVQAVNKRITEASKLFPETMRRLRDLIDVLDDPTLAEQGEEAPIRFMLSFGERTVAFITIHSTRPRVPGSTRSHRTPLRPLAIRRLSRLGTPFTSSTAARTTASTMTGMTPPRVGGLTRYRRAPSYR